MRKGLNLVFSGVVQGVGFRWFVLRAANRYGVKGYVKNRFDGAVEAYAEGDESSLRAFFDEVRVGPSHAHVAAVNYNWVDYKGNYTEFRIE
jgi:acylphosphatase